MPRFLRIGLVLALFLAPLLALGPGSRDARAQVTPATTATATAPATACTATPGGQPTVSVNPLQIVPNRIVNGVNLGTMTRPAALNPNGVSYSDCIEDMVLQFPVTACNFDGQNLEIWASRSSNCTDPMDRGVAGVAVCWPVSPGSTGLVQPMQNGESYNLRVQDIVGPQNESPSPTTMTSQGPSACTQQSTYLAVPININFIPINPGDSSQAGPAYEYTLDTDLVGPPAPSGVGIQDGDTLFVVNWTPNLDTDTGGYDVLIDPIPGQEPADATTSSSGGGGTGGTSELLCPADSGMSSTPLDAESSADTGADTGAVTDAASDGSTTDAAARDGGPPVTSPLDDAGCMLQQMAGSGTSSANSGGACADTILTGGTLAEGGAAAVVGEASTTDILDEAGDIIDSSVPVNTGVGGIFNPPTGHIVNPNPAVGTTATGETNSTYTITGLTNQVTYHIVVSAVDNFGNVGPPSAPPVCDFPAPVNDFWKIYRTDGGQAGGGFCALEAVGAPAGSTVAFGGAGALVIAGLRRRRRSKRR